MTRLINVVYVYQPVAHFMPHKLDLSQGWFPVNGVQTGAISYWKKKQSSYMAERRVVLSLVWDANLPPCALKVSRMEFGFEVCNAPGKSCSRRRIAALYAQKLWLCKKLRPAGGASIQLMLFV
ncbi:hypothetical protein RHMOL_Rhmol07G0155500 [Rhododendron molle]|uniref:Uncharacterized protein n=1 Tax=Rhododendron molle TaxID=49168 RepID=A0ACC0N0R7_RHOML|nr:hypothetical protein RHMOL_Rhmol07G0155500 [Rhododendron molle]